jgi:hypothetical protein
LDMRLLNFKSWTSRTILSVWSNINMNRYLWWYLWNILSPHISNNKEPCPATHWQISKLLLQWTITEN